MKGVEFYYAIFQTMLNSVDPSVAEEFDTFAKQHTPREVFLWLEERKKNGNLPIDIEPLLTDFYWEIS